MSIDLKNNPVEPPIVINARGIEALEQLRPQYAALTPDQLIVVNTEMGAAITRALGVAPVITEMRPIIERQCPEADHHALAELEVRALGCLVANDDWVTAMAPPAGIDELVKDVFDARTYLNAIVEMFVTTGYLQREQVTSQIGGRGYRDAALDASSRAVILIRNWRQLEGKAPITLEKLIQVQGTAEELLRRLGKKEISPERMSEIADTRVRAFTLLDKAYSEARRVVTFIRWHEGDADTIVPPLRSHPLGARKADDGTDAQPGTQPNAQPGTTGTGTTTPAPKPADPTKDAKDAPAVMVTTVPATPAPSGLPRSNPYATT